MYGHVCIEQKNYEFMFLLREKIRECMCVCVWGGGGLLEE